MCGARLHLGPRRHVKHPDFYTATLVQTIYEQHCFTSGRLHERTTSGALHTVAYDGFALSSPLSAARLPEMPAWETPRPTMMAYHSQAKTRIRTL